MSEFECAGCGKTLMTNVHEDAAGKHWSFDYAFAQSCVDLNGCDK
jgi:hypothetical protein